MIDPRTPVQPDHERGRADLGIVVIGRNEGQRLQRCFDSIAGADAVTVYVDSGSTDGSVDRARAMGIDVVDLDSSITFTAGRARNEGFKRLRQVAPSVRFVQFVDGDCEIDPHWLGQAKHYLEQHDHVACVCGDIRERFPDASLYHQLNTAWMVRKSGETDTCGGISMMRADTFESQGGFNPSFFVGEERELCRRMRAASGKIWQLPAQMALHDGDMLRFAQWWKRTRRTGYSQAQALSTYGLYDPSIIRPVVRAWFWAFALPVGIVAIVALYGPIGIGMLLAYPLLVVRVATTLPGQVRLRVWCATFMTVGKFAELTGQWQYWLSHESRATARSFDKS